MQIYCPKCKTGYEIEAAVVPEKGRKLRCAVCGRVFRCLPEDLTDGSKLRTAEFTEEEKLRLDGQGHLLEDVPVEPEAAVAAEAAGQPQPEAVTQEPALEADADAVEQKTDAVTEAEEGSGKTLEELEAETPVVENQDVKDIFERLSRETEALFKAESEEKSVKKYWFNFKKVFGLQNPRHIKYYLAAVATLLLLFLYYARFEVVRAFPLMDSVYRLAGIKAYVTGEGLEFQNVSRRDFEEDFVRKFEVKGFIANQTSKTIDIPTIKAELLDNDARAIQAKKVAPVIPLVTAKGKVPFSFVIEKPSRLSKYIFLTFVDGPAD